MPDGSFQSRKWVSDDKDLEEETNKLKLITNVIQLLTMAYPSFKWRLETKRTGIPQSFRCYWE